MAIRKLILTAILAAAMASSQSAPASEGAKARIAKETRHEILSLPYFDVFDNIEFRVDGYNVTLMGQVTRPTLKSDAEGVVKGIEGVENVSNQIEVLPLSPNDDRLRIALYRAIYGFSSADWHTGSICERPSPDLRAGRAGEVNPTTLVAR